MDHTHWLNLTLKMSGVDQTQEFCEEMGLKLKYVSCAAHHSVYYYHYLFENPALQTIENNSHVTSALIKQKPQQTTIQITNLKSCDTHYLLYFHYM